MNLFFIYLINVIIPLIIMILNFSIDYRQLFSSRSPFIEDLDQLDETNLSYNIA